MINLKQAASCKMIFIILLLLWLFFLWRTDAGAFDLDKAFLDGVKDYKEENFAGAIANFSKIVNKGVKNGGLYYNLGNAYLKNGDLGHAVLWYERAFNLMPNDPNLKFNLKYASSLVKDKRDENEKTYIFQILFFWKDFLGTVAVKWTGIILNALFWLILTVQIFKRKKIFKTASISVLVLSILFILTALYNCCEKVYIKQAVILSSSVSVRSGLSDDSTQLFILHSGTKVKVEKEKESYFKIYFSEGKIGWIKKNEAGII